MASPTPMRKVETTYETTRPRDASIRQQKATNDNYTKPANDNQVSYLRPTVDKEFNATYAKAGVQSQSQLNHPIRKVKTENFSDGEGERVENDIYNSNVNTSYGITTSPKDHKSLRPAYGAVAKVTGHAEDKLQRLKITRVNAMIIWPSLTFWLFFQLPLAFLNLIMFGAAVLVNNASIASTSDGFVTKLLKGTFKTVTGLLEELTGISIDPTPLFFITAGVVFFLGLAVIILISIVYTLSSVRFLFGSGAALKITTYVFAIFCYLMPFFNIFPWHLLWMAAVYRYPK